MKITKKIKPKSKKWNTARPATAVESADEPSSVMIARSVRNTIRPNSNRYTVITSGDRVERIRGLTGVDPLSSRGIQLFKTALAIAYEQDW